MTTTTTTTTTTTEEFTFPISHSAAEAFIDSPPLWRHVGNTQATSSTSSFSEEDNEEENQLHSSSIHTKVTYKNLQRKSFSSVEGGIRDCHRLVETEGHDRMDLLWEDFNQDPLECNSTTTSDDDQCGLSRIGCVPTALNLSKTVTGGAHGGAGGGRVVIAKNKKLRMVVLAKVLKRLFLLQHQPVKKRSW